MATYNFPPTSRYYGIPTVVFTRQDGEQIVHLARRFVPGSERFALLKFHSVLEGERMDLIAHSELGDAEVFWRICDGNDAMRPDDLTAEIGRKLRITLPEGIPAPISNT
jgi:hypothetical protein